MSDLIDTPALTLPDEEWQGIGAAATEDAALYLELDGWEGPLDLLLDLARRQKVDLRRHLDPRTGRSVPDLYRPGRGAAAGTGGGLPGDGGVARLPQIGAAAAAEEQEDPSPEELALRLQLRLQRLGAMREAAARLMGARPAGPRRVLRAARPKACGSTARTCGSATGSRWSRPMGRSRRALQPVVHMVRDRMVMTLDSAIAFRRCSASRSTGWNCAISCRRMGRSALRRSALASSFVAALELARHRQGGIAQERPSGHCCCDRDEGMTRPDELVRAVEATLFAARSR
jgi:segregation and condensation protein A